MAWTWSYSVEGLDAAYTNLQRLPIETLRIILAEWEASQYPRDENGSEQKYLPMDLDLEEYESRLACCQANNLPADVLADLIWPFAEQQSLCDNGGSLLWLCPYGCDDHKVAPSVD